MHPEDQSSGPYVARAPFLLGKRDSTQSHCGPTLRQERNFVILRKIIFLVLPQRPIESAFSKQGTVCAVSKRPPPSEDHSTLGGDVMSATPPLRKLEYVLAVARELHFGKAAERVHVVQSSISRQVREVEAELGFEIFRRTNHVVDFTDEGRPFVLAMDDSVAKFYAEFKRARDISRLISRRNARTCLIGYSPFVPAALRHEIRSIRTLRFPSVHLEFRLASASGMFDSLGSGIGVQQKLMRHAQVSTTMKYGNAYMTEKRKAHGAVVQMVLPGTRKVKAETLEVSA